MRELRLWGTVAALVVAHLVLTISLGMGEGAPDLLTLALLIGAREVRIGVASGLGFLLGLVGDGLRILTFGAGVLAMTVLGALGSATRTLFVGDSLVFLLSYLFLGKWSLDLIQWILVGDAVREPFVDALLVRGPLGAAYMTLVGLAALFVSGVWRESIG